MARSEYEKNILKSLLFAESDFDTVLTNKGEMISPPGMTMDSGEYRNSPLFDKLDNQELNVFDKIAISNYRGYAKLFAGAASLPASGLELLGLIDKGSVNSLGTAFEKHLADKAPPQTGLGYSLIEGVSQFLVPGLGYYKLFGALTRLKGFDKFLGAALKGATKQKYAKVGTRLFGAEFFTVMTAQNPTDPNFIGFMTDMFGLDEETSTLMQNEIINSIATPARDWEATSVFREKLEAVPGDLAVAGGLEAALDVGVAIIRSFRKVKNRQDQISTMVDEESVLPNELIESNATKVNDNVFEVPENPFKTKDPIVLATPMKDLIEGARQAKDARTWYTRHNKVIGELFGEDAQFFKELIGVTSQQASVDENINRALKAYEYFKTNGSFKDLEFSNQNELGLLQGVIGNLQRLDGSRPSKTGTTVAQQNIRERMGQPPTKTSQGVETYLGGDKVPDFVEAMFEGTDEVVTIDRHMVQILFGQKSQIKPSTMAEGKRVVTQAANELGWTPKETQAAIWSFNQMKDSDIVQRKGVDIADVRDYKKAIEDRRDTINELLARFK